MRGNVLKAVNNHAPGSCPIFRSLTVRLAFSTRSAIILSEMILKSQISKPWTELEMNKREDGIVYSTAHGRMCPECGKPAKECVCQQKKAVLSGDAVVRIGRETKGRKGKGVTVITGIPGGEAELKELGRQLKAKCGAGGTLKNGVIEIQGDHRQVLLEELSNRGWKIKLVGG